MSKKTRKKTQKKVRPQNAPSERASRPIEEGGENRPRAKTAQSR